MPGNIIQATPTDVMPANLAKAFHMELHMQSDVNQYGDGSSDRNALAVNDRKYFTLQETLLPDDWKALRGFFYTHQGVPFYFYNMRETVPPYTFDPTGQNPIGRYTVAFDGQWSETYNRNRAEVVAGTFKGFAADVSFALREVQ